MIKIKKIITREGSKSKLCFYKNVCAVRFLTIHVNVHRNISSRIACMNQFEEMRPKFHGFVAGRNYTGYDFFFRNGDYTGSVFSDAIPEEEVSNFAEDDERPDSIESAVNYFIVGVAIGRMNGDHENKKNNRSMFVNMTNRSRRETDTSTANISHENIRKNIDEYISYLRTILETINHEYEEPELCNLSR